MLSGASLFGSSSPEAQSTLYLGPAFGDSLARGVASAHVASFDELDAPFFRRLGDYLQPVGFAGPSLHQRLRALGRDPRGTPWQIDGPGLQVRLDVVRDRARFRYTATARVPPPTGHAVGGSRSDEGNRTVGEARLSSLR